MSEKKVMSESLNSSVYKKIASEPAILENESISDIIDFLGVGFKERYYMESA